jgi:pyruvate-ferredoxin/flavodoxin oxidoreductase
MSDNGKQQVFPYPGIETTADGTTAVVWVATHITDGACAYPITSSSAMGAGYQVEVANGKKNLWGRPLFFLEPESEHSSASAAEGFAAAGGRVANFTSGQGLVLMKEVLYTIAGKRLPAVFHIGARALTSHSLNVHAGHDDVMAVGDTGWGILFAKNAQATCDLALIARRAGENSDTPFLNCQDGFLTTHTVESVRLPEPELMRLFVGDSRDRLVNLMDPHNPMMSGVVQNQDSYMKGKIAQRAYYDKVEAALVEAMDEFFRLTGRRHNLVEFYRMDDAEYAIVGMGSMIETCEATADFLRETEGLKVGAIHVTTFRPFPGPQLVEALKHVKAFAVVERMDNPMAQSNPLTVELKAAFSDALTGAEGYPQIDRIPAIYSGSAGLGSRDVRAGDFVAAYQHMARGENRRYFVLGIRHPLGISAEHDPDVRPKGAFSMRGHSVGGYGSVTTNKIIATIGGDLFGMDAQAYPKYGSEKKGLPTTYYLTLADDRIRMHSELNVVDFIPVNNESAFLTGGNPLAGLCDGGTVFIQSTQTTPEEVWARVPTYGKRIIRQKKGRVLALDAARIARKVATDPDLEVRMQGIVLLGIFLKATPYIEDRGLSRDDVMKGVEKSLRKYFGHRGEQVIQDNLTCVRRGYDEVFEIPPRVIAQNLAVEMPENLFRHTATYYG